MSELRASLLLVLLALPLSADQAPSRSQVILDGLNQSIGWSRRIAAQAQLATEPADVIFVDQNAHLARQVLALGFEAARAAAALPGAEQSAPGTQPSLPNERPTRM